MNELDLNDKLIDEIIGYAAAKQADRIALSCSDDVDKHEFSREFNRKMEALLAQERRQGTYRSIRKWGLRACIFILVLIATAAVTIYSVDALRIPVVNYFMERGEKSALITPAPQEESYEGYSEQIHGMALPAYIPEGYVLEGMERPDDTSYIVTYAKGDQKLRLTKFGENFSIGVDTEGAECTEPVVNGEPAYLVVKKDRPVILVFKYKGSAFKIIGYVDKYEAIKIAESLKYFK